MISPHVWWQEPQFIQLNDDWLLIFHHSTPQFHIISFMISPHVSPHVWLQKASKIHHFRMIFLYFRWITSHFFGINPPRSHPIKPISSPTPRATTPRSSGVPLAPFTARMRSWMPTACSGVSSFHLRHGIHGIHGMGGWGCPMGVPCSHVGMAMECLV